MSKETKKAIEECIKLNQPCIIWGEPGIGKTSFIRQLAEKMEYHLEVVIASIREPSDFGGLPFVDTTKSTVSLSPPQWAQNLIKHKKAILFLDEISCAAPAVQAALLRVVFDRVVGDIQLPKETVIVAAANPADLASGGWELTPALANRFVHLTFDHDANDWIDYMMSRKDDTNPSEKAILTSFIKRNPALLLQLPKDETGKGQSWPSPRSWDRVLSVMSCVQDEDTKFLLSAGNVGEGAAREFLSYRKELDLPDPEELINDYKAGRPVKLPDRQDTLFACLMSVASFAISKSNKDTWIAGFNIVSQCKQRDIAVVAAKILVESDPALSSNDLKKVDIEKFTELIHKIHNAKG